MKTEFVVAVVLCAAHSTLAQDRACCLGNNTCLDTNQAGCDASSGEFLTEGSTCATTDCSGACCRANNYCNERSRDSCDLISADFQGAGTTCLEHCATRLGTLFTYQGQIKKLGVPLSGPVDLEFSVWTTAKGGDQIGSLLLKENVLVAGGLFSVLLDFDAEAFSGNTRWLEIAVRSPHDETDSQPFTTLSSRQLITPTPYALQTRGLFVDDFGNIRVGTEPFYYYTRLSVQTPDYGVLGLTEAIRGENSFGGYGVLGVVDNGGVGIQGEDQTTGDFPQGTGVSGTSSGEKGFGVRGVAQSLIGLNYGGHFYSRSDEGIGVLGWAGSNSGTNFGVKGHTGSADGYAGYFTGGRNYFEGTVGIGTTAPSAETKLHIEVGGDDFGVLASSSAITGSEIGLHVGTTAYSGLVKNSFFSGGWKRFDDTKGAFLQEITPEGMVTLNTAPAGTGTIGWNTAISLSTAGDVAMGRTTPSAKLDVDSDAGQDALRVRVNGGTKFVIKSNGRTAVGANFTPAYTLQVGGEGTAGKPNGGSWASSSDRRLKKNIKNLEGSLDRLMKLRSVTFEYKNPEAINERPGERIGMIAQEVEKVFPDWVGEGGHGYKTLAFSGFEALTVDAFRELRAEKDGEIALLRAESEEKISKTNDLNDDLQARVAKLEALVAALAQSMKGAN